MSTLRLHRHTLQDECRVLLVHGILHLLGFDHEIGAEESIAMAEAERYILNSLQWKVLFSTKLAAFLRKYFCNILDLVERTFGSASASQMYAALRQLRGQ